MSDRQCSSCGGFCGRGGCKRENVKVSKQREALELALKALERGRPQIVGVLVQQDQDEAMQAIREALYEPARKPLTDSEVFNLAADYYEGYGFKAAEFARAIERAHGITND